MTDIELNEILETEWNTIKKLINKYEFIYDFDINENKICLKTDKVELCNFKFSPTDIYKVELPFFLVDCVNNSIILTYDYLNRSSDDVNYKFIFDKYGSVNFEINDIQDIDKAMKVCNEIYSFCRDNDFNSDDFDEVIREKLNFILEENMICGKVNSVNDILNSN